MYRLLWGSISTFVIMMVGYWLWVFHVPHWSTNDYVLMDLWGALGGLVYLLFRWVVLSAPERKGK